ncbi:MAG: DeoR/GlpR transcriptional regulator [Ruminococcaceae bacterium]|nr:DeoR/GlpR transcriptional regulator [Oscillospiraceae bacterium]
MLAHERQAHIIDHLREHRVIKITDIVSRFGVSNLTARRDLDVLQEQKIVRRVYGGAILSADPTTLNRSDVLLPPGNQEQAKDLEKKAIGKLAATLVREGDILFMGSGNTVLEVARNLRHLSNLTIITSSLSVINELSTTNNTIYVLGGRLDYSEHSIEINDPRLESFCADKAFISCDGVTLTHGVTASHPPNVSAGQLMVKNAKDAILVANSRKFGNNALSITCKLSELSTIVSDDGLSKEYQDSLAQQGVHLMLASMDEEAKS